MLIKVNSIDSIKNKVKVTQLDIDDYGSVIPLKELELNIPADDDSIIQTLKNSSYAAIFTEESIEENTSIIILANGMTIDDLNKEKSKTIDKAASAKQIWLKISIQNHYLYVKWSSWGSPIFEEFSLFKIIATLQTICTQLNR